MTHSDLISSELRERHYPDHTQRRTREVALRRLQPQPELAGFARGIDLDEDVERATVALQMSVERFRGAQAVERLKLEGKVRYVLRLVGLQMADDASARGRADERFRLAPGLLDLVLAERRQPGG